MTIQREMVNLPNGWHRVPGDGEAGSPDERKSIVYNGTRFEYWAMVSNGVIIGLTGSHQRPDHDYLNQDLIHARQTWGVQNIADLFPRPDEWEKEFTIKL